MKVISLFDHALDYASAMPDFDQIWVKSASPTQIDVDRIRSWLRHKHNVAFLFIGGDDVCPQMYGEDPGPYTHYNSNRCTIEREWYDLAKDYMIPCVGICRGAQFLWVMNGGKLHQHVPNHGARHQMYTLHGEEFPVTSSHHQMLDATKNLPGVTILGEAKEIENFGPEPEVFVNSVNRDIGFQYHPEWMPEDSEGYQFFQHEVRKMFS